MTSPARNISVTSKFKNCILLRATCNCTSAEHDHNIAVEVDEFNLVTVSIYQDLEWMQYRRYGEPNFIKRFYIRLKNAIKYLVTGRVSAEGHFVMDYESLIDYTAALDQAAEEIRKNIKANT